MKKIIPSIKETAFICPYCEVLTTQYWWRVKAKEYGEDRRKPSLPEPDKEIRDNIMNDTELESETKESLIEYFNKIDSGLIVLEKEGENENLYVKDVINLNLSQCYECKKVAVWVHDRLVYPFEKGGISPNKDLPDDIIRDFEEARDILNLSPRGSSALLRLAIQKLCVYLGEKGKKIDDDIASMVSKGLNPIMQKSLDIVRVIGNEAVHPGVLDIKDDRDTANELFGLINLISDQMITNPKNVNEMYEKLPKEKLVAIEERNKKARK